VYEHSVAASYIHVSVSLTASGSKMNGNPVVVCVVSVVYDREVVVCVADVTVVVGSGVVVVVGSSVVVVV
jgi:hypothetical protein